MLKQTMIPDPASVLTELPSLPFFLPNQLTDQERLNRLMRQRANEAIATEDARRAAARQDAIDQHRRHRLANPLDIADDTRRTLRFD